MYPIWACAVSIPRLISLQHTFWTLTVNDKQSLFDTTAFAMTLIKVVEHVKVDKIRPAQNPLLYTICRDGILYYTVILCEYWYPSSSSHPSDDNTASLVLKVFNLFVWILAPVRPSSHFHITILIFLSSHNSSTLEHCSLIPSFASFATRETQPVPLSCSLIWAMIINLMSRMYLNLRSAGTVQPELETDNLHLPALRPKTDTEDSVAWPGHNLYEYSSVL